MPGWSRFNFPVTDLFMMRKMNLTINWRDLLVEKKIEDLSKV